MQRSTPVGVLQVPKTSNPNGSFFYKQDSGGFWFVLVCFGLFVTFEILMMIAQG